MTLNGSTVVMWRGAQRDPQLLEQLSALMCVKPIRVLKCHVPPVPRPFSILMPSNTMASRCIPLGLPTLFSLECVILFFHLEPCEYYFRLECICTIVLLCVNTMIAMSCKKVSSVKNFLIEACEVPGKKFLSLCHMNNKVTF